METIQGVHLLDLKVYRDGRGDLVAFENATSLPFPPRRVFYMRDDGPIVRHALHTNSSDLFLTAVTGSVTIDVDNGKELASLSLTARDRGVWIQPGIMISLRNMGPGTVLLACASSGADDSLLPGELRDDVVDQRASRSRDRANHDTPRPW